ncbi:unnamed protein product [Microthlaspi erraticum]|uniref:F-box domain-containing protein n=1 Tax=Microthlaspi erraticum TaxID=1685480 RepID=A0A6D2K2C0_9BRAS|nr:unnamed protein product [Microthlaspi erraticum]CAA7045780.1 unnamed protein product [Microthlaspi erraticum]
MSTVSDLSEDLVGEIFYRVPLTSLMAVRSTCRDWNALSNIHIMGKKATSKQFLGFRLRDSRVYSMKFNLQGVHNDYDIVDPCIKIVSVLGHLEISKLLSHCNGLVLCVTEDLKLLLWNPYLGQTSLTKRSKPLKYFSRHDKFGLGYDNIKGYHKILRVYEREDGSLRSGIYDCNSNLWRLIRVTPEWDIRDHVSSMSLNGNNYFLAHEYSTKYWWLKTNYVWCLLCFDYTAERFGPLLPLPFQSYSHHSSESVALSCVRDEQLALLYIRNDGIMKIWITTKIDPNSVSWSMFLEVDTRSFPRRPTLFKDGTFFIDDEKKVAVVCGFGEHRPTKKCWYHTAYIIGEDGYFKSVDIGETLSANFFYCNPVMFSSYVPSLVQLK